jgi:hypothetical protein
MGHTALKRNAKNIYKIIVGKSAGRCPLEKPRLDLNGNMNGRSILDLSGCG